mmetsp:Transcript_18818/g.37965  ORF Transcript_18818/g.37965 Transcript_18818/m.37965 type:complete len:287 (+) Transcript_18818:456-1316(+)
MRLDLGELELRVIRVHRHELVPCWRAQHLDDLDELVDPALAWEDRLSQDELGSDACRRPNVDDCRVIGGAEDELWRAVVTRADVSHVRLAFQQTLRRAEVAEFQGMRPAVDQQVLRLDVTVADSHCMNVGTCATHLVGVELYEYLRHRLLHLIVVLHDTVDGVGTVLHDHVEVRLTWLLAGGVERMLELDHVGVSQLLHDLQLTVLVALVLVHFFDRDRLAGLHHLRLVHDPEGTASQDALGIVGERRLLGTVRRAAAARGFGRHFHAVQRRLQAANVCGPRVRLP